MGDEITIQTLEARFGRERVQRAVEELTLLLHEPGMLRAPSQDAQSVLIDLFRILGASDR